MPKLLALVFLLAFGLNTQAQSPQHPNIDIQHYRFELRLSDKSDSIKGKTTISVKFLNNSEQFHLDLVGLNKKNDKGMKVTKVFEKEADIPFQQKGDSLILMTKIMKDSIHHYTVVYQGIPADGLIISKNKFGERTFFGDNWPTRAHQYLPCVDHPADKASLEFIVDAPNHYNVIANGYLLEETNLPEERTRHHWKCEVLLPTKVMVIGAARFAVQNIGKVDGTPISSWVYTQDRDAGFYDYAMAKDILRYFIKKIGPYPYSKLANVQSKTRFGGMENAGNIFYSERSVTGKRTAEDLIAHEIVHQWFGNSASESDWPHLWLSEGFATYLTDVYVEENRSEEEFKKMLSSQRQRVIAFYQKKKTPVVDTISQDLMEMLNVNAYQKGAWVLHMLRREIGDSLFFIGIRSYYDQYKFSNASTEDFQKVMETTSKKDLSQFFKQWLHTSGQPLIEINGNFKKGLLSLEITQKQANQKAYDIPLELNLVFEDKTVLFKSIRLQELTETIDIELAKKPVEIVLDPNVNLLHVGKVIYK